jgi:hypothetical protein
MRQLGLALFLSCSTCSIVFSPAVAQNYMPLDPGTQWIYGSPTGPERDTVVAVGPAVFDGVNVIELRYRGFNNGLSNFWTVSADGTVSFHGFDRPAESFAYHYIPPIRFVHPPVEVGATWRDTVLFHCVRDCSGGDSDPVVFVVTVNSIGPLTVPAGTFTAAGIELATEFAAALPARGSARYSIFGTKVTAATDAVSGGPMYWWADGVGLIQYPDGWNLVDFARPTPVKTASWGRIKSLYR